MAKEMYVEAAWQEESHSEKHMEYMSIRGAKPKILECDHQVRFECQRGAQNHCCLNTKHDPILG